MLVDPVFECGAGPLMSARYRPDVAGSRPFAGRRLDHAVCRPMPADFLVAAHPETITLLPAELRHARPWIVVLNA